MYAQVIIDIAHAKGRSCVFPTKCRKTWKLRRRPRIGAFGKGNTPKEGYIIDISEETAYRAGKIKPS